MNITIKMLSKNEAPCADGLAWFMAQEKKDVVSLAKAAIKAGKIKMQYCAWGLNAVMTREQRTEWGIFCAYQVAYLWKDKHPKEYAIWHRWANGDDRSEAAWEAAAVAARTAAWAAGGAAVGAAARTAARVAAVAARMAAWVAGGARTAAREAARMAAWAAGGARTAAREAAEEAARVAAYNKMLAKLLRYGVKILMEKKK